MGERDLVVRLSHELAVLIELTQTVSSARDEWPDALAALRDAKAYLQRWGLPPPPSVESLLRECGAND